MVGMVASVGRGWVRWTVGRVAAVGVVGAFALSIAGGTVATVEARANLPTFPTGAPTPPSTEATQATQATTEAPDLTGKWRMALDMEMGRATPLLELTQNEGKLSGTYTGRYGSSPVSGEVDGRSVKFAVAMETTSLHFRGELKDDGTLAGTADFGEMGTARWTAAREQ